jgi:uncharacterized hydrophobic protein (TIGR00341 family)
MNGCVGGIVCRFGLTVAAGAWLFRVIYTFMENNPFMAQRKVEIFIHTTEKEDLSGFLERNEVSGTWWADLNEGMCKAAFLSQAENSEALIDRLDKKYSETPGFRIILSPVEAVIPRVAEEEAEPEEEPEEKVPEKKVFLLRISRAELYDDIKDFSEMSRNFLIMVVLSSVVAGIGILNDNIPVLVGAMVIAPLLGPNLALAFGTVLGDIPLVRTSAVTGLLATVISLVIAFAWGVFYRVDTGMLQDPGIRMSDIVLAFMSGAAGAVTILRGGASALVGVMVAVALLPPLIRAGLFAGGGYWMQSMHAFLVFMANTICVNLAGILTFIIAGITPKYWWEEKKARNYSRRAAFVWAFLLLILVVVVILLNLYSEGFVEEIP